MNELNPQIKTTLLKQWGKRISFDEVERKICPRHGVMTSMVKPWSAVQFPGLYSRFQRQS